MSSCRVPPELTRRVPVDSGRTAMAHQLSRFPTSTHHPQNCYRNRSTESGPRHGGTMGPRSTMMTGGPNHGVSRDCTISEDGIDAWLLFFRSSREIGAIWWFLFSLTQRKFSERYPCGDLLITRRGVCPSEDNVKIRRASPPYPPKLWSPSRLR